MKFRKDITDFLIEKKGSYYKKKDFKFYEKDGKLYNANYNYDSKNKIDCFTRYSLLWHQDNQDVKEEIKVKFGVSFPEKGEAIVCKCGKDNCFSAKYGQYELLLMCNSCGNEFQAYSG